MGRKPKIILLLSLIELSCGQNNSKVILPWSDEMHFRIEKEPEPTAKEQSRDKMSHAAVKNETLMALGKRSLLA